MGTFIWFIGLAECVAITGVAFYFLFKPRPINRRYSSTINATHEREEYEKRYIK